MRYFNGNHINRLSRMLHEHRQRWLGLLNSRVATFISPKFILDRICLFCRTTHCKCLYLNRSLRHTGWIEEEKRLFDNLYYKWNSGLFLCFSVLSAKCSDWVSVDHHIVDYSWYYSSYLAWINNFYIRLKVDVFPEKYQGLLISVVEFVTNLGRVITPQIVHISTAHNVSPIFVTDLIRVVGTLSILMISEERIDLD